MGSEAWACWSTRLAPNQEAAMKREVQVERGLPAALRLCAHCSSFRVQEGDVSILAEVMQVPY